MAKTPRISMKHKAIDKANAQMVAIVAVAAFVTIFCLVAAKAQFGLNRYQARVTEGKEKANTQLQQNIKAFDSLAASYKAFNSTSTNIISGNSGGTGDNDGPNSKIILNALPSTYDFPALTSSIEKILKSQNLSVASITGTDDQVNQQENASSPTPQAVEMPFSFTVNNANYESVNQLMSALQRSIRPIQVDSVNISGGGSNLTVVVNAHTYYQPGKSVTITKKAVK